MAIHSLGTYLDEPQYRVFWEALTGHDVPLYLHPNSAPLCWSVFEGSPELLGPTYAWAIETGAHALRLVFSGLFDQFPTAKVILGQIVDSWSLPFVDPRRSRSFSWRARDSARWSAFL